MKPYYAYNYNTSTKCFCKYELAPTGILYVYYYLPKYRFSIYWPLNNPLVRVHIIRDTKDGRKTVVAFAVHPSYWLGASFESRTYYDATHAIHEVFTNHINLYPNV